MGTIRKFKQYILPLMLTALVMLMAACTGDTNNPAPVGNDSVQGVVVDTTTGAPIAGAVVKAGWSTTTTDKSGVFNLGSAPYTINSGNIAMPDASYVVAIDMTNATNKTGYSTNYFRRVTVGQAAADVNILRIGKTNSSVKGTIINADGTMADKAVVTLTYVAVGGASSTSGQNGSPIITASSIAATTSATGAYTITGVESGSQFVLHARSADGAFTIGTNTASLGGTAGVFQLPPIDNYTFQGSNGGYAGTALTSTTLTFAPLPDGGQPLRLLPVQIAVGTTAATGATQAEIQAGGTVQTTNGGDFAAGAVTVTFPFTKAVKKSPYTDTTGVYQAGAAPINSVLNDVDITQTAKTGNIPYTVAWSTDMKSLIVTFTSSVSMIYTVDITKVLRKILDANGAGYNGTAGANGALAANTGAIAFSTSGAAAVGGTIAGSITQAAASAANDIRFNYGVTVSGAAWSYIYVRTLVNGVIANDYTAYNDGAVPPVKQFMGANGTIDLGVNVFNLTTGLSALATFNSTFNALDPKTAFYRGIDKLSYRVKVVYLNSDKIEKADGSTAVEYDIADRTAPFVTTMTADNTAVNLMVGAYVVPAANLTASTVASPAPTEGRAKTSNAASAIVRDKFISNDIRTVDSSSVGGTNTTPAQIVGDFYAIDPLDATNTKEKNFIVKITFDEAMDRTSTEDKTKWGITDTAAAGATPAVVSPIVALRTNNGPYTGSCSVASADAGNVPAIPVLVPPLAALNTCAAGVTAVINSVSLDPTLKIATVNYSLSYKFVQPYGEYTAVTNPAGTGTVYRVTVPHFLFTFTGTDLKTPKTAFTPNAAADVGIQFKYAAGTKGF